jgi:hypothetical protein
VQVAVADILPRRPMALFQAAVAAVHTQTDLLHQVRVAMAAFEFITSHKGG